MAGDTFQVGSELERLTERNVVSFRNALSDPLAITISTLRSRPLS